MLRRAAGAEPLLSAVAAAELVDVSPATVRRAIRSGALEVAGYVGSRPRVRRDDVVAWIARGRRPAPVVSEAQLARPGLPSAAAAARARRCDRVSRGACGVSVHRIVREDGSVSWLVRWREGGRGSRMRARRFDRKADAVAFEDEIRRRRRLGELVGFAGAQETLNHLRDRDVGEDARGHARAEDGEALREPLRPAHRALPGRAEADGAVARRDRALAGRSGRGRRGPRGRAPGARSARRRSCSARSRAAGWRAIPCGWCGRSRVRGARRSSRWRPRRSRRCARRRARATRRCSRCWRTRGCGRRRLSRCSGATCGYGRC